jgi:AcrR family transcriptional regulator
MVRSAAALISSRGMNATSFSEVLSDSGAPRGSIYHHFPEGKKQLAQEAVRWTSDRVLAHQRECVASNPVDVLNYFINMWRRVVSASHAKAGCTVAGVTIDADPSDGDLLESVRSTFRAWVELLTEQLQTAGVPAARASPIAIATLAGMEGALILCRAEGTGEPLENVAGELLRLLP